MSFTEMSALALARAIRERKLSVPEALNEILVCQNQTDAQIHAYLTVDPGAAMARAQDVQAHIDRGEMRSPLAGVPIAIKDNLCTEGMRTTCASRMLADFVPPYSATAVRKLR